MCSVGQTGLQVLGVAAAMGNHQESFYLCNYEWLNDSCRFQASKFADDIVAKAEAETTDWQAMTLTARCLAKDKKRPRAVKVALKVRSMECEPTSEDEGQDADLMPVPCKTWVDVLNLMDGEEKQCAREYGQVIWDDREACVSLSLSIHQIWK
jgi:hypothetical protein